MRYRRLGNSGLMVSEIALGTMTFGEKSDRGVSPDDARRQIDFYLDQGGNHFDIADVYAAGQAEKIVGEALKGRRGEIVLTSKIRWPIGSGPNQAGLSRYHILNSVEASLGRLETDRIDVLYMHGWDAFTPLEESLRTLDDLVRAGKVRYLGVSNFVAWQAMKALGLSDRQGWVRFVAAQYQYSLAVRDVETEIAPLCEAEGMGLVSWAPLGGGFLSGKYQRNQRPSSPAAGRIASTPDDWEESWARRDIERNWQTIDVMREIASREVGRTISQVALAWVLAQANVSSVIVGARTTAQLEENLRVVDLVLSLEECGLLDSVSAVPPPYPARAVNRHAR